MFLLWNYLKYSALKFEKQTKMTYLLPGHCNSLTGIAIAVFG
jgi:hypothetical protein